METVHKHVCTRLYEFKGREFGRTKGIRPIEFLNLVRQEYEITLNMTMLA